MTREGVGYLCLGTAIGAVAAILLAPKSGEETRAYMQSKATDATDYVKSSVKSSIDGARNTVNDTLNRGKDVAKKQVDNLSAAIDAGKQAYQDAVTERFQNG
jgi:gas vesicle protein